ncbi:hypothetical protein EVAR_8130_1 [Eumeta japonica]|uniref:Uncharacterized protein n=1 Tax=Eumeta variegata TaxID=151549 RepID=A0A4C1TSS0_EUMVA|nr:hypothetical protein EVAR_8130_1 [Eumeta japonica]
MSAGQCRGARPVPAPRFDRSYSRRVIILPRRHRVRARSVQSARPPARPVTPVAAAVALIAPHLVTTRSFRERRHG